MFPTRVLVAVDGSEEASRAALFGARLADALDSELHLVSVGPLPRGYDAPNWGAMDPGVQAELISLAEQEAGERAGEQAKRLEAAGFAVAGTHAEAGSPEAAIVDRAEEVGAGLVVVGSRGLGALRRVLIGSVSEGVVRHAHCPVLVVRGNADDLPERIVLAVDGSKEAAAAARAALEIAGALGSELHVIYTIDTRYVGPMVWDVDEEKTRRDILGFVENQRAPEAGKKVVPHVHLAFGRADAEVIKLERQLDAGLTVIGSRGLGGVRRALLGSVSTSVIRHAYASVLVVR